MKNDLTVIECSAVMLYILDCAANLHICNIRPMGNAQESSSFT
jgi:hypothetical protein